MGLRELAEADLDTTLEGDEGVDFIVTDPAGATATMRGLSWDIGMMIDANTGQATSGRQAHVTIRIASLTAAGMAIPVNISETDRKPWIFDILSVNGEATRCKAIESRPDRTLGVVTVALERFRANV